MNKSQRTLGGDQCFRSISDVARLLQVSVKTVRRWIERGELIGHRFGRQWRIHFGDLEAFIKMRRQS